MGNAPKLLKAWEDEITPLWYNQDAIEMFLEGITIDFEPEHFTIRIASAKE